MSKETQMPLITANMAISLDGKISDKNREAARFTPKADLARLLELRVGAGAILVGKKTLEADNMRMTIPDKFLDGKAGPLRCVISREGKWNHDHPAFSINDPELVLFRMEPGIAEHGEIPVKSIQDCVGYLRDRGVERIHCEGGGELLRSLLEENLLDELNLTWNGAAIIGGAQAPTLTGSSPEYLMISQHFELVDFSTGRESECYLKYRKKA